MCRQLCCDPDQSHYCAGCGNLLCYDADGTDPGVRLPVLYDGDLYCGPCAREALAEDVEDAWEEADEEDLDYGDEDD